MATRSTTSHMRKSIDTFRNDKPKKSKSKKRHSRSEYKMNEHKEPTTPPLPIRTGTMEELMKQRETLQEELKKISNSSEAQSKNIYKSKTTEKKLINNPHFGEPHKRRNSECLDIDSISKSKKERKLLDTSPHHFDENSEDEEDIIENRRKQRKQLLEKLKSTLETNHVKKEVLTGIINHEKINDKTDKDEIKDAIVKPVNKAPTDMFAEIDDFTLNNVPEGVTRDNNNDDPQLTANWDDPDGYYNIRIGDLLNNNRYTIKDTFGQGVFANVVRAQDTTKANTEVAIKITRNNDLMKKTALKEIAFLKDVNDADPDDKYHCVKLLRHFVHKEHLCLVLEPLHMDLRCIIKKYGRNGLNLKAVVSYSRQLLLALRHLKKLGIIHADVKPDNILVNEKKNTLKLCDFGSAGKMDDTEPTPYLVSRFYRAPEIILGVTYSHEVDTWSAACTIYEMAVGKILFTGNSNNKMLKCFMDVKGKIPNRLARKGKFKDQHFNYKNNFLLHKKDEITGRDKVVELSSIKVSRDLAKELGRSITNEKKLSQLKELLDKMLSLDPSLRIAPTDALKHIFIREELQK